MSTLTINPVATPPAINVEPVTPARVLRSEWIKMRTLRSTGLTLAAAFVAMIAVGWIVAWSTNSHFDHLPPDESGSNFSAINVSLNGVLLAQLGIGVLGVLLVTGEYATGMIRATLAAIPQRLPVLWAKAALYGIVTFALMLIATLVAFLGGQHFLATHGTTLSTAHAVSSIIGAAGYLTLIGILAVAFGFIIRSTAGGIAALVGLLLVLPGIGAVLPTSWQSTVLPYLPSNAGASMYKISTDTANLSAGAGLLVLTTWVAASLAAAAYLLKRRDA